MPLKNSSSLVRNTHMPKVAASRCRLSRFQGSRSAPALIAVALRAVRRTGPERGRLAFSWYS